MKERGAFSKTIVALDHLDLWLFPIVVGIAWFYYPYCEKGPVMCLSKLLLHRPCPGCGLTRGISFLVHGKMAEAIRLNPLSLVVLVLMASTFVKSLFQEFSCVPGRGRHMRSEVPGSVRFS